MFWGWGDSLAPLNIIYSCRRSCQLGAKKKSEWVGNFLKEYRRLRKHWKKRQTRLRQKNENTLIHQSAPFTKVYPILYTLCTNLY